MTIIFSRNGRTAEYNPLALDEKDQWVGDRDLVTELLLVTSRYDEVEMYPGVKVKLDPGAPMFNALVSARYLGMEAIDSRTITPSHPIRGTVLDAVPTGALPLAGAVGASDDSMVTRMVSPSSAHAMEVNFIGSAPAARPADTARAGLPATASGVPVNVVRAAVPAATHTLVPAPVPPPSTSPIAEPVVVAARPRHAMPESLDGGDSVRDLMSGLDDRDSSVFSRMLRDLGMAS